MAFTDFTVQGVALRLDVPKEALRVEVEVGQDVSDHPSSTHPFPALPPHTKKERERAT